jgi:hypothetical protein
MLVNGASARADALGDIAQGGRQRRVKLEVAEKARHLDLGVVHQSTLGTPRNVVEQRVEPAPCLARVDPPGDVFDMPRRVVEQHAARAGAEQRHLRHATYSRSVPPNRPRMPITIR